MADIPPQGLLLGVDVVKESPDGREWTDTQLQDKAREFMRNSRPVSVSRGLLPRKEGESQRAFEAVPAAVPTPLRFCMSEMPFAWVLLGPIVMFMRRAKSAVDVVDLFLRDHTQDVEVYSYITPHPVIKCQESDIAHMATAMTPEAVDSFLEFCKVTGFTLGDGSLMAMGTTNMTLRDPLTGSKFRALVVTPITETGGFVPYSAPFAGVTDLPIHVGFDPKIRTAPGLATMHKRTKE